MRRVLQLVVVFILSISTATFGLGGSAFANSLAKSSEQIQKPVPVIPKKLEFTEDPEEVVRVIVEMKKAPAINSAKRQNVQYINLSKAARSSLEKGVLNNQEKVKAEVSKIHKNIKFLEKFTTIFNGFSAEVQVKHIESIYEIPGVKAIYKSNEYQRPEAEPKMRYSKELVQAQTVWTDYGYKGEGMIVGIIDTGIDPSHKDMILSKGIVGELTEAEVKAETTLLGKYYTEKVPYGYNYMDKNDEILDLGSDATMHGMHVAGTVGANGNEVEGGLSGVAPEAQLLALKVFSNKPGFSSTFGDIYVKAIDDAIKLGADVLNLSLGATAGFVDPSSPEQEAVKRAVDSGILVSIAAGNSNLFGDGYWHPYAENQDYGVTGSPSVANESFGVASFENSFMQLDELEYSINGAEVEQAFYLLVNQVNSLDYVNTKFKMVEAGFGKSSDFTGKNVEGKVVLVSRGEISSASKALNAQAAGAAAIIIYNNVSGILNLETDTFIKIPQIFMRQIDGNAIAEELKNGNNIEVTFTGNKISIVNPSAGLMSKFTSWGPTPNLDFKPEITAPGGQILSTLNKNQYGFMSGTSMAAPHVSGGAVLVFQRIAEKFPNVQLNNRVQMAKNIIMNTSSTVDHEGVSISPRRQGAGLMQLANALATDVVVTNKATGEAKVTLKEIKNDIISMTFTATNYSNEIKTYNINTTLFTDTPKTDEAGAEMTLPGIYPSLDVTNDSTINSPSSVTVPANGSMEFTIQANISDVKNIVLAGEEKSLGQLFKNGFFIDGFVKLIDTADDEENVELTVPFFGFNGSWDDAPIFDYFAWDKNNRSYYGMTALAVDDFYIMQGGSFNLENEYNPAKFAFSPNGDGIYENITPLYSLFRNARDLSAKVVNSDGKALRTLAIKQDQTKNYYDGGRDANFYFSSDFTWDGKVNGVIVDDGQYHIELSAVIDYPGAQWQSIKYPIIVDNGLPKFSKAELNVETSTIAIEVSDNLGGTGIDYWGILVNGQLITDYLSPATTSYTTTLKVKTTDDIEVVARDFAGNEVYEVVKEVIEIPHDEKLINEIYSPKNLQYYLTEEVIVSGTLNEQSAIKAVTVNGESATITGNAFTHTLTFEDGVHDLKVKVINTKDQEEEVTRKILVDTTAPTIALDEATIPMSVGFNEENPRVKINISDNFDEIHLFVNENAVFTQELAEPFDMRAFNEVVEVELPLTTGENSFKISVKDINGQVAVAKTFKVMKEPDPSIQTGGGPMLPPAPAGPGPMPPSAPSDPGTVSVNEDDLKDQILNPVTSKVTIKIPDITEAQHEVNAEIPAAILKNVVSSAKPLVVSTGGTEIQIPANVLKKIATSSPEKMIVKVSLVKEPSILKAGKILTGVYEYTISVEKNGKTTYVSEFDHPVLVKILVTEAINDVRKVAAYYMNETTNKLEYMGGKLEHGNLLFKTNHFSKYVVIEKDQTFEDIKKHWAQDEIEVLASRSITAGKSFDEFLPQGKVTRAEFAVLIARAFNLPLNEFKGTFIDVSKSKVWAYAGVEAAYEAGIVKGLTATVFSPDALITREEIATMIVRAVKYQDPHLLNEIDTTNSFADASKISAFAKETVKQATALGIVNGRAGNTFDPKANATRAESAAMLYRSLEKLNEL